MGYGIGAVEMLTGWVKAYLPERGAILELGDQQINEDVPDAAIANLAQAVGTDPQRGLGPMRRVADVFRGSAYTYRCVDLFPGEDVIVADLNTYCVPEEWRGRFDITTNFGTTEHILDQVNTFRAVHDFAKVGAPMHHSVPCLGYFNHGLFAYSPAFFLFLAEANAYEIETINISSPHLEHTLPNGGAFPSADAWRDRVISSGLINAVLRKSSAEAFRLFTDHDATRTTGQRRLPEKWLAFLRDRYDLRVRTTPTQQS